jgi:hypothetical protein
LHGLLLDPEDGLERPESVAIECDFNDKGEAVNSFGLH